jgi:hypothetical protein
MHKVSLWEKLNSDEVWKPIDKVLDACQWAAPVIALCLVWLMFR